MLINASQTPESVLTAASAGQLIVGAVTSGTTVVVIVVEAVQPLLSVIK